MEHLHSLELPWIKALQKISSPAIDSFFKLLNLLDTGEFIMILMAVVWIGSSWKLGIKFFHIVCLSALLNVVLKKIFQEPRPFHIDPSLAIIRVEGYGFPSGAAQSAVLLPCILLSCKKNRWTWLVAANFFFWVSLSRVYLGVHFPSDLVAGWLLGVVLVLIYLYPFPIVEKYLEQMHFEMSLALSILVPLALLYFFSSPTSLKLVAANIGAGIGSYVSSLNKFRLDRPKTNYEMIYRMMWGSLSAFAIYVLAGMLPLQNKQAAMSFPFFCFGLWLGLGALWQMIVVSKFSRIHVE